MGRPCSKRCEYFGSYSQLHDLHGIEWETDCELCRTLKGAVEAYFKINPMEIPRSLGQDSRLYG